MTEDIIMKHGFYYVPIDSRNEIDNMLMKVKEYFNLPLDEKMRSSGQIAQMMIL